MAELKQFKLPDAGEGLTEAEIVSWKVAVGDTVTVNQTIVEIETAKSLVELPSPFAGVVSALHVAEGETVEVGTPIISVDVEPSRSPAAGSSAPATEPPATEPPATEPEIATGLRPTATPEDLVPHPPAEAAVEPGLIGGPAPGGRTSVLVGYGPRTTEAKRRPRGGAGPASAAAATLPVPAQSLAPPLAPSLAKPLAKPPVRKLAKDLGVDLALASPTGPGGTVTRDDVLALADGAPVPTEPGAATTASSSGGYENGPRETRTPIRGVRKMTAAAMVRSAFTAPHVTEWVSVDVTRTMELVDRLRTDRAFAEVKVSPLLVVAKALLIAVRRNPAINTTWDEATQEVVTKHYVNLGIAAATPRGLVVPNVKDAHTLDLRGLADALAALTTTAREGRTQPADMSGGSISITNVGVFGVDGGTPILNPGEAAILCAGQIRPMAWVYEGALAVRQVMQLTLSFDHRLVDGDLGSRTLADVAAILADPAQALVWG